MLYVYVIYIIYTYTDVCSCQDVYIYYIYTCIYVHVCIYVAFVLRKCFCGRAEGLIPEREPDS